MYVKSPDDWQWQAIMRVAQVFILVLVAATVVAVFFWPSAEPEASVAMYDSDSAAGSGSLEWVERLKKGEIVRVEIPRPKENKVISLEGSPEDVRDEVRRSELIRLDAQIHQRNREIDLLVNDPSLHSDFGLKLREAELVAALATAEACRRAVQTGDYVVLKSPHGAPTRIPDAITILGARVKLKNGEKHWSYYVLTREKYPQLFDSRVYQQEVAREENRRDVAAFNSLPLADRRVWIERVRRAKKLRRTMSAPDFRAWKSENLPRGYHPAGKVRDDHYLIEPWK